MDDLLLSKVRLSVIAALINTGWVTFSHLARAAQTTNGNLGAHVQKLLEAGYIDEEKAFVDRRPQTRYRLSQIGHDAFVSHVQEMQQLLQSSARSAGF